MNLPLVFDIATGLIFIFLTLSLLASEIQELITTVLQWRADHLKKSIEVLLTGNSDELGAYQKFVDQLYHDPLIKALNQESKGLLPRFFRGIIRRTGAVYRTATGARNVFGDRQAGPFTGPSYIPSKPFAEALLQKLDLELLTHKVSEFTIRELGRERLAQVEAVLKSLRNSLGDDSLLEAEFNALKQRLDDIRQDFRSNRVSLSKSIDLATEQIQQFIDSTEAYLKDNNHCKDIILGRLPYLKQAISLKKLEPTLTEVLSMVMTQRNDLPAELAEVIAQVRANADTLPPQLKRNLLSLADQAQMKTEGLRDGVRTLEKEVEDWYNRSMDRASGVYRRNAKGVAIVLGILIATATNTDTFLVVDRLTRDTAVRQAIAQSAEQLITTGDRPTRVADLVPTNPALPNALPAGVDVSPLPANASANPQNVAEIQQELSNVRDALDNVLDEIPLPIGWNQRNMQQQFGSGGETAQAAKSVNRLVAVPKAVLGWVITGIAISMGSSFWFDLLGKIVRVRNTGSPTKPSASD